MGTLWNTYAFYVLYANIDNFDPTKYSFSDCKLTVMDKWLISKLNSMVKAVDENLNNYKIPEAAKALQNFVDEMSNWYVRRNRERYWVQSMTEDKITAYMVLYKALVTTAKAAAPMIPFMAESIYQNLVRSVDKSAPESIHLCDFPKFDSSAIDEKLEQDMETVLEIVVLGRAARNGAVLKNRQPLNRMFINSSKKLDGYFTDIIKDELNIKNVEFTDEVDGFVNYTFKPQLKTVGPKFGRQLNDIRAALSSLNGTAAKDELDSTGKLTLNLPSGTVELTAEDLLIETSQKEGFYTVSDKGVIVSIDTVLTPELIAEGVARELISKIQTMRKEAGFNVTDHITVKLAGEEKILDIAQKMCDDITKDTLADSLSAGEPDGFTKDWDINGEKLTIGIKKV